MNEKNIVDSLCDSIENNSQIINFKLVDRKHLNLKDNLMTWKIYAFIQLKDIGTSFDKYIEDMNEFMNSFKFNYDERTLNLDYIKQFKHIILMESLSLLGNEEINVLSNVLIAYSTFIGVCGATIYYISEIKGLSIFIAHLIVIIYILIALVLLWYIVQIIKEKKVVKNEN